MQEKEQLLLLKTIFTVKKQQSQLTKKLLSLKYPMPCHFTYVTYIYSSQHLKETDLIYLINQIPKSYIIFGDFNSYTSSENRIKLMNVEIFIDAVNLLNTNTPSHFCTASGRLSTIELSLYNPSINQNITRSILSDLMVSPISSQ